MTKFIEGQPVAHKKTGTVMWVLVGGDEHMTLRAASGRRYRGAVRNYEEAGEQIAWSLAPSTSYEPAKGGWL